MGLMPAPTDVRWALALDVTIPTLGMLPGFMGAVWAASQRVEGPSLALQLENFHKTVTDISGLQTLPKVISDYLNTLTRQW